MQKMDIKQDTTTATIRHICHIQKILETVLETQQENIEQAASLLCTAIEEKKSIYAFGSNHAGILAQELYYRTGGLVVINYVCAPGLALDVTPPTLTTAMERLEGYGKALVEANHMASGDILILHSVSGRNSVPIEMALEAKQMGVTTICLTNMNTTTKVDSRSPSGKKLYQVCDYVIDNCGDYGDATLSIPGFPEKVAPSSTAVGAVILNAMVARVVEQLVAKGHTPPVFLSSNVPEGDAHNAKVMNECKEQIFYL